jgi:hypothetical protein
MKITRLDRTAARKAAAARAHDAEFLAGVAAVLAGLERLRPHLEGEEAGAFSMAHHGLVTLGAMRAGQPFVAPRMGFAAISNGGRA